MATHTFEEFWIPQAELYASMIGVRNDLTSTLRLCDYFEAQFSVGYPPVEITDAFSTAILIRYFRAFPPLGVRRWPWKSALASLSSELKIRHESLRQLRSKHIAHSVNELEEHRLQARYTVERFEVEGITAISAASYTVSGLSSDDVQNIRELSRGVLAFVERELAKEGEKLLPTVRSMTLEQLRATIRPLTPPRMNRAHMRRGHP